MKKVGTKLVRMTAAEIRARKIPESEMISLQELAALSDDQIDTSDIPDAAGSAGGIRGLFYRPPAGSVTVQLRPPDLEAAQRLSQLKGVTCQAFISDLLHEALSREVLATTR